MKKIFYHLFENTDSWEHLICMTFATLLGLAIMFSLVFNPIRIHQLEEQVEVLQEVLEE